MARKADGAWVDRQEKGTILKNILHRIVQKALPSLSSRRKLISRKLNGSSGTKIEYPSRRQERGEHFYGLNYNTKEMTPLKEHNDEQSEPQGKSTMTGWARSLPEELFWRADGTQKPAYAELLAIYQRDVDLNPNCSSLQRVIATEAARRRKAS